MTDTPAAATTASTALGASRRDAVVGRLWALFAVSIWMSWIVLTRLGVSQSLNAYDIVALRWGVAGLVLLPVLWKLGLPLAKAGWLGIALMVWGSGAPYSVLASVGLGYAPASHAGPLLPGVMPMFAALLAWLVLKEHIAVSRRVGLVLILAGVLSIAGPGLFGHLGGEWVGHLMLLSAAFSWAVYTVTLRRTGVAPLHAVALVSVLSAIIYLPVYATVLPSTLLQAPWQEVVFQGVFQGIISAAISLVAYNRAVALIGASKAAAFSALVPAGATLMAIPVLGEIPAALDLLGVGIVSVGVLLATGSVAFGRKQ